MQRSNTAHFYRYGRDLYFELNKYLRFVYSYEVHRWMDIDKILKYNSKIKFALYETQGITKKELTPNELFDCQHKFEKELASDYAKTKTKYYRFKKDFLFKTKDEDKFEMYLYNHGWIEIDWLFDKKSFFRDPLFIAEKMLSKEVRDFIKEIELVQNKAEIEKINRINLIHALALNEDCEDISYFISFSKYSLDLFKVSPRFYMAYKWSWGNGWTAIFFDDFKEQKQVHVKITHIKDMMVVEPKKFPYRYLKKITHAKAMSIIANTDMYKNQPYSIEYDELISKIKKRKEGK